LGGGGEEEGPGEGEGEDRGRGSKGSIPNSSLAAVTACPTPMFPTPCVCMFMCSWHEYMSQPVHALQEGDSWVSAAVEPGTGSSRLLIAGSKGVLYTWDLIANKVTPQVSERVSE